MAKQTYLVGVDGSEWGERAAQRAVTLAKQTGAEVVLMTIIPWSGFTPMTLDEIANRPLERSEEEKTAHKDILDPLIEKFGDDAVTIRGEFAWGHPTEEMHKRCKELKANMIFVGRRGRSRIADLILGSVANSLAHTAGVPVVLVP